MKVLVMIRVSTESQELVDQHREMEVFCRDEGYDELVFVEDKGASAIKLNDQYRLMIDQVKEETPLFTVRKIVRPPLGKLHPRAFKKLSEW